MKNPKNTVWRIALFLLTVVCGLLMADRGENEFPVFACSEALSGESGSTGLLLQQNMWEVVPLLGYGIVEQQGTQNPEEDETTCRTLTTEDLISEELLLPQPEETQQTALIPESVEATAGTALSNFRPAVQQVQIDRTQLADYETLVRNFYAIDANTMAGSDQLSVEKLLGMDMTLPQEGDGPQILIYHTHSQETFADSREGQVEDTIVGVGDHLAELLEKTYGYRVLHVTDAFDMMGGQLDRSKAYDYARASIEKVLEENPSVEVVIDLHRDGVPDDRHLVTEIDGKPTAQLLFYNGLSYTVNQGEVSYLPNPYIEENLAFSFQLEYQAAQYYPKLYRGIYLAGLRYNLHLKPRALLLEAGAQTNTVEEVRNAMEPFADILNRVLKGSDKNG